MFLVRFTINFCISFVILSIPINNKTIFNHLYQLTGAMASKNIKSLKKKSESLILRKKNFRKNMNQEKSLSDFSATQIERQFSSSKDKNVEGESYTDQERERMRRVFEKPD